jgi:ribulose-phosphate 3-epimerase
MEIIPSILEPTASDYQKTLLKLSPYFSHFQIDIADGIYVDNQTASIDEIIQILTDKKFSHLAFDFHLMVKDYQTHIDKLKKLKDTIHIKNVLIHFDLYPNYSLLTTHYPLLSTGFVLNPQDQVSELADKYNLKNIQSLQIMSVNPGRQGQPFLPETLKKIEQLRLLGYRNKIFLDGGVNEKTIPQILAQKFLPDVLCPGSFLTKAGQENLSKRVYFLIEAAQRK